MEGELMLGTSELAIKLRDSPFFKGLRCLAIRNCYNKYTIPSDKNYVANFQISSVVMSTTGHFCLFRIENEVMLDDLFSAYSSESRYYFSIGETCGTVGESLVLLVHSHDPEETFHLSLCTDIFISNRPCLELKKLRFHLCGSDAGLIARDPAKLGRFTERQQGLIKGYSSMPIPKFPASILGTTVLDALVGVESHAVQMLFDAQLTSPLDLTAFRTFAKELVDQLDEVSKTMLQTIEAEFTTYGFLLTDEYMEFE